MELTEFQKLFDTINRSAFRLQLLDCYSVEFEKDDFESFMCGTSLADRSNHPWLKTINTNVTAGHEWTNLHSLPARLTPYLRYIIDWWYVYHAQAGADVRFLLGPASEQIRSMARQDFWFFDDFRLVWMDYDETGRFRGPRTSNDPDEVEAAKQVKRFAIRESIDLKKLLSLRRSGEIV